MTKLEALLDEAQAHYLPKIYDTDEVVEDLKVVNFIRRFFNKLHANKLINVQLLVNHEILLYNIFDANWITNYQLSVITPEHHQYLKTVLLYIKQIDINDKRFENIPVSYDLDYLLQTKSERPSYLE
jgi:hypothetical protein